MKAPKNPLKERELRSNATKSLEALKEYYIEQKWTGSARLVNACISKLKFLQQL